MYFNHEIHTQDKYTWTAERSHKANPSVTNQVKQQNFVNTLASSLFPNLCPHISVSTMILLFSLSYKRFSLYWILI